MDKRKGKVQPPDTTMGHIVSASNEDLPEVDLEADNLLQDYVIHDPVPLDQKASSDDVKKSFWTRKRGVVLAVVLVLVLAGAGVATWMIWQQQQGGEIVADVNDEAEEEPYDQLLDLEFDSQEVIDTYGYIERVVYADPFLSFYPVGSLTRGDLSAEQLAVLRSEDEAVGTMTDDKYFVHRLYSAEGDEGQINLYEVVTIARPAECTESTLVRDDGQCVVLYNLNGALIDLPEGADKLDEWWNYGALLDHFRWIFLKNTEGTYTLQSIDSVKHLAQDTVRFLPQ